MKAILCNDCGAVMAKFSNVCKCCSRTNLTFYSDPKSEELQARIAEIRALNGDHGKRMLYAGFFLGLVLVVGLGIWQSLAHHYVKPAVHTAHSGTMQ